MTTFNDGPLQLVDFKENPDASKENRILNLHEENVTTVFRKAGDRPVAIAVIAGPSRKGKSFFLDFVIRYFYALENGEEDWMNWKDKAQPLLGFSWKTSTERETNGILIWSKPFIIKSNGCEIAVILMDTQGTYDEYSTDREITAIVGISLLSSSCLIFNFPGLILEDVFNSLDVYIKYGHLALGETNSTGLEKSKPFQKLMFLIRDWTMPTLHPYGFAGGRAYLQSKLELKPGMIQIGAQIRTSLPEFFSNLDCCLLPGLGDKSTEAGFNGCLAQLSKPFTENLEELINELFKPDAIPLKTICGSGILGLDMLNYFKEYVAVFNSEDFPAPLNLMEATAKVCNDALVNKCFRKYLDAMKTKQRGKRFLSSSLISNAHTFCMTDAIGNFTSAKKLGGPKLIAGFQDDLQLRIEDAFHVIESENGRNKENFIREGISEFLALYSVQVTTEFPNEEAFLEESKLKSLSESCKSSLRYELQEKLDLCDQEELAQATRELEEGLKSEEDKLLLKNTNRKFIAEKTMREEIGKICALHKEDIQAKLAAQPFMMEQDLSEYHTELKPKSLKRFDRLQEFGYSKDFVRQYSMKLEEGLEKDFDDVMKIQQNKLSEVKAAGETLLEQIVDEMDRNFRSILLTDDDDSKSDLETKQATAILQGHMVFHNKLSLSIPPTCQIAESLMNKFKSTLSSKLDSIRNEIALARKEIEESDKAAVEEAFNYYIQDMGYFVLAEVFHEDDALTEKHEEVADKAKKTFETLRNQNTGQSTRFEGELESKIQRHYTDVKARNEEKKTTAISSARLLVNDAHRKYQSSMSKKLDRAQDDDHFQEFHENEKRAALDHFELQCEIQSGEILNQLLEELESQIENTFEEELLDLLQFKLKQKKGETMSAISKARKVYQEEFEKHYSKKEFMLPQALEELHASISTKVVKDCGFAVAVTQSQLEELRAALQEAYTSYKETNAMNIPTNPAIGIDLGTTYSCVAVYLKGAVKIIPNTQGRNTMPSYVRYNDVGECDKVGAPAKREAYSNSENTIFDAKRIIGRQFDDPALQLDMKFWPFTVVNDDKIPKIQVAGKKLFPEQVSAEVLKEMKSIAEKYLNCPVKNAVITVPAYFNDGQRQATIDAGRCAGLNVLKIEDEPVAAAIAYKLQHCHDHTRHVLIFDLGGGTFDVAILKMTKGKIETLGKDGDTHLGGEDFDKNVMRYCTEQFKAQYGIDLMAGKDSTDDIIRCDVRKRLSRLQEKCEDQKKDLTSCRTVDISVSGICNERGVSRDLMVTLTRDKFEELNDTLFASSIQIVERCLKHTGIDKGRINDVVLVGGSTRIPKVQELLSEFFQGKALTVNIDPEEAVAYGAAVRAAIENGQIAQTSKDYNEMQDVCPMSIGVELHDKSLSVVIPKNTKIPIKVTRNNYTTVADFQVEVPFIVYQGEDIAVAKNNDWLGHFNLTIPSRRQGEEKIDVTMEIDYQGVLHVTAVCTSTGGKNSITVAEDKRRMTNAQIHKVSEQQRAGPWV